MVVAQIYFAIGCPGCNMLNTVKAECEKQWQWQYPATVVCPRCESKLILDLHVSAGAPFEPNLTVVSMERPQHFCYLDFLAFMDRQIAESFGVPANIIKGQ